MVLEMEEAFTALASFYTCLGIWLSGLRENLDKATVWHEVMRELFEKLLWEPVMNDCHTLHGHIFFTGMKKIFPPPAIK